MSRNPEFDNKLRQLRSIFGEGVFAKQMEPLFNRSGEMVIGKCDKPDEWANEAQAICDKMLITYEAKDTDYAANGKPMGNFRMSEEMGIPAWKGVLIRMGDKRRRIESFANKGTYEVADEKVDDTMIDLSNYSLLDMILLEETAIDVHDDEKIEKIFNASAIMNRIAKNAIVLTILFRKGKDDPDVIPWNKSNEYYDLLSCWKALTQFAKTV